MFPFIFLAKRFCLPLKVAVKMLYSIYATRSANMAVIAAATLLILNGISYFVNNITFQK